MAIACNTNQLFALDMECEKPAPILNAHFVDPGEYNCTSRVEYECDPCYKHVSGDLIR